MSGIYKFRAVIEDAGGGGAFVKVPFDVEEIFCKKRVKVKAMIEGEEYRGSLVRMGDPCHILGVRKDIRQKIGKTIGDEVEIIVEEDTGSREIALPPDLESALRSDPGAEAAFQRLAYSHRREYVEWIEAAKREQTRRNRIDQTLLRIKQGKKSL